MNEIEKEEKEKLWYYSQLQGLSKRLEELPHVETVSKRGGEGERVLWVSPAPGQKCGGQVPGPGPNRPSPRPSPLLPAVLHADGPDPAAAGV